MQTFRTGYMDKALFQLDAVIENAVILFRRGAEAGLNYDTLVGTGMSGALVVPSLARALEVDFLIVRKQEDDSHHSGRLMGTLGERWVFVDDFTSTGGTRNWVIEIIKRETINRNRVNDYFLGMFPDVEGEVVHGTEPEPDPEPVTKHVGDFYYARGDGGSLHFGERKTGTNVYGEPAYRFDACVGDALWH